MAYGSSRAVAASGARGLGSTLTDLDELRVLANRGLAERRRYLDALEETYGDELRAGNAQSRRLLIELSKSHAGSPGTPLAKEFFERLLPLLPKADHEIFLKEMLNEAKLDAHKRLEDTWGWWRRLWYRF
jgi:hypothetical protein